MGVTPEDLQAKIAQISARYLDRVSKEVVQLRGLVERAAGGDLEVAREIETLTHRMHGSGAMLQFDEISAPAGELERLCADFASNGQVDQPQMLPLLERLQAAVDKACAGRSRAPQ